MACNAENAIRLATRALVLSLRAAGAGADVRGYIDRRYLARLARNAVTFRRARYRCGVSAWATRDAVALVDAACSISVLSSRAVGAPRRSCAALVLKHPPTESAMRDAPPCACAGPHAAALVAILFLKVSTACNYRHENLGTIPEVFSVPDPGIGVKKTSV